MEVDPEPQNEEVNTENDEVHNGDVDSGSADVVSTNEGSSDSEHSAIVQASSGSQHSGNAEDGLNEYKELLKKVSEKWLMAQLTHNVSAAATNSFWHIALNDFTSLSDAREHSMTKKNIPGYIHLRRQLYKEKCPEVHMRFVYLNKESKNIEVVHCDKDPGHKYPKSKYTKLFEEAHIKVNGQTIILLLAKPIPLKLALK